MIFKGDVYYADLNPVIGSEQGGVRPIVAPMTTKSKTYVPMHVTLKESFLAKKSTLLLEQIRTIDKKRLIKKIGTLSKQSQERIEKALDKNFYI